MSRGSFLRLVKMRDGIRCEGDSEAALAQAITADPDVVFLGQTPEPVDIPLGSLDETIRTRRYVAIRRTAEAGLVRWTVTLGDDRHAYVNTNRALEGDADYIQSVHGCNAISGEKLHVLYGPGSNDDVVMIHPPENDVNTAPPISVAIGGVVLQPLTDLLQAA